MTDGTVWNVPLRLGNHELAKKRPVSVVWVGEYRVMENIWWKLSSTLTVGPHLR